MFRRNGPLFNAEGTAAPSGAQPAVAAPVTATAAPAVTAKVDAPPIGADGTVDPAWLNTRLERERSKERSKLLKEIGAADTDSAKAAVTAAQTAADAKKSAEERALEAGNALAAERARLAEASALVSQQVTEQMSLLSAEQQAAIRAIAPDSDPIAQLKQLRVAAAFRAGAQPAAAATATAATAPATPAAAASAAIPATTAPAPAAPPAAAGSPPDYKAEYQRLKATNPVKAAAYMNEHANKIYPPA